MKEIEFGNNKIYKNTNPSSILDYVGGKLGRRKSLTRAPHIINYQRNRNNLYSKPTLNPKVGKNQKITLLIPVFERHVTDEESSSNDSKKSKKEVIQYKHSFKQYKSVNTNNYQFNNNNFNNFNNIYNSSNTIYNYSANNRNILNNNYLNNSNLFNENNNIENYSPFKDDIYSNINLTHSIINNSFDEKSLFELDKYPESEVEKQKQKHKDFLKTVKEIKKKILFYNIIILFVFVFIISKNCLKFIYA